VLVLVAVTVGVVVGVKFKVSTVPTQPGEQQTIKIPKITTVPDGEPIRVIRPKPTIDTMKRNIMKTLSECYYFKKLEDDSPLVFSSLKEIAWETRCWIVDGKVITMSEYRRGRFVKYTNVDDNDYLKNIVQSYVDIFQPAKAFVMDVCQLVGEDTIKIVEINCINCAGFYASNLQKLVINIDDTFNTK
jgi:hypothetical protein